MVVTISEPGRELRTVHFDKNEINVGREIGNDVVLTAFNVDLRHARILYRDGRFIVADLRSAHGTSVNGRRISQATIVREGDKIRIGPYELRADASDVVVTPPEPETDRDFVEPDPPTARGPGEEPPDSEAPTPRYDQRHDQREAYFRPGVRASAGVPDPTEKHFLEAIEDHPNDDASREVYSDWLEEQGRVEEAELIRVQLALKTIPADDPRFTKLSQRMHDLVSFVEPIWRRAIARPAIEKCDLRFELVCPRTWDSLQAGEAMDRRFCTSCKRDVFYAQTIGDAQELANAGHCVAVNPALARSPGDLEVDDDRGALMGAIAPITPPPWAR